MLETTVDTVRGQVALVTGAGRGLGRAIVTSLARAGADVGLVARSVDELTDVAEVAEAAGVRAVPVVADLGNAAQLEAAVRRVRSALGPPLIVVNNAALVEPLGATRDLIPRAVQASVLVNVVAPITISALALRAMGAAGWGRIVNVSAILAVRPAQMPGMTVYAASKAALEAHTLNLAAELTGSGISANILRPGTIDTPMQQWIRDQRAASIGADLHARFMALRDQRQLMDPQGVADALVGHLVGHDNGQIWDFGGAVD